MAIHVGFFWPFFQYEKPKKTIGSGESLSTPGRVPEAMPGIESHQTGGGGLYCTHQFDTDININIRKNHEVIIGRNINTVILMNLVVTSL